jgi:hypothetical protein
MSNSDVEKRSLKGMWISLALFVMALVPRVMGLNIFFTIDERPYTERAVKFLGAMLYGHFARTYRGYEPAVTTMWGVALGMIGKYLAQLGTMLWGGQEGVVDLREFVLSLPILPIDPDLLFAIRLTTVLVASLTVVGTYFLVRRIFNDKVALLSAALLAFDPFYLAHSRVVHMDALGASFMILAVWVCHRPGLFDQVSLILFVPFHAVAESSRLLL